MVVAEGEYKYLLLAMSLTHGSVRSRNLWGGERT